MQAYFPRKVKNSMFRKGISCKEFITVITTFIIALWMVGGSLFFLVPTFVQLLFLIILFVSLFLTNGIGGFRYIKKISALAILLITVYWIGNSTNNDSGILKYNLIYVLVILFTISAEKYNDWFEKLFKIAKIGYLFYAICTITMSLSSNMIDVVCNIFPANAATLRYQYSMHAFPGMTNHYSTNAMLLAIGAIIFIAEFINRHNKNSLAMSIIFIISILLTGKRAHIIFLLATIVMAYYIYLSNRQRSRVIKMLALLVGMIVVGYLIFLYVPALAVFIQRFGDAAESGDVTLGRTAFWTLAIEEFKKHPIFGIGWGEFQKINPRGWHAHNIYVQILCETGIVGFSLYLIWFLYFLVTTTSIFLKERKRIIVVSEKNEKWIITSFCIQAFFLLYGITGNPIYDKEMFIPYFVACAAILTVKQKSVNQEQGEYY